MILTDIIQEKSKLLEVVLGQTCLINTGLNKIKQIYLFHTFLNLKILRYTVNLQGPYNISVFKIYLVVECFI